MQDKEEIRDHLITIVSKAAIATKPYIGSGEKEAGDQAAVDAMRSSFEGLNLNAVVRVGEGEKDEAPMLYVGEELGNGQGLEIDIAVDPVEGTALMARGEPNAITVIAATDRDGFWDAGSAYYMDKIVVGSNAKGVIDINKGIKKNIVLVAKAMGKPIEQIKVYVLDKPRHIDLVKEIKSIGAKVSLHAEGDVIGSVLALMPDSDIDMLVGVGGAPEAVITAAAVKVMGGDMQGKLRPQSSDEESRLINEGVDLDRVIMLDDLVKSDWAIFSAAGVTSGLLLDGVTELKKGDVVDTEYIAFGPHSKEEKRGVYSRPKSIQMSS